MKIYEDSSVKDKKITIDAICVGTLLDGKKSAGLAQLANGQILPFETRGYGIFSSASQNNEQNNALLIEDSAANGTPVELCGTIKGNPGNYLLIVDKVKYSERAIKAFARAQRKKKALVKVEE